MKSVLISIQPKWCEKITRIIGQKGSIPIYRKSEEIRKTKPKLETPFKCHIYCTSSNVHDCLMVNESGTKRVATINYKTAIPCGGYIGNGKVIGEFVCDCIANYEAELWDDETYERIQEFYEPDDFAEYGEYEYKTIADNGDDFWRDNKLCQSSCLTIEELRKYVGAGIATFYGWHISDLVIYDKPKELSEFYTECKMDCEHCEMWGYTRVNADEFDMDCKSDWFNHKPLKRPPQSWCYIEHTDEKGR